MTRDEAITILIRHWTPCTDAFGLVTAMEALGILKIEKKISAQERFLKNIEGRMTASNFQVVLHTLEQDQLQIIEKGQ